MRLPAPPNSEYTDRRNIAVARIRRKQKATTDNPGLFGQQSPSHPGLRALQDRKRQLEHVVKLLEGELRGK